MKFKLIAVCFLIQSQFPVYSQLWSKLDFKLSYGPNKLYVDTSENKLIILGKFTKINDTISARGILAWNGQNYETFGTGFDDDQTLYTQTLSDVIKYKNKLYVGGYFNKAGNVFTKYLAQWDGNQWDSVSNRFDNGVNCLKIINDTLYIGGYQKKVGNIDVEGIVKFDGTNFHSLPSFHPYSVQYISVIENYNGHLYVGGYIKDSTGYQVGVMKLVGNKWITVDQGIRGSTVFMYKLKVFQNKLIATGVFYQNSINVDSFIQSWNDTTWSSVGGGTGNGNGAINDMVIIDNKLYCSGVLSSAGGISAEKFAIWDGTNWCGVGSSFDNTLNSIAYFKDTIYVCGNFWSIDGDSTINKLAKWIGGNYVAACGNTTETIEINKEDIEYYLYPNPSNSRIAVRNLKTKGFIVFYNYLGQSISTIVINSNNDLDVSNLQQGLYIYQLFDDKKNSLKIGKFIKE